MAERLRQVQERIRTAALGAHRDPSEVRLVAVCKTYPAETVAEAVACGQTCFGENKVQEAAAKIPAVQSAVRLEWHLVGHLQSNKAQRSAELFDWVHSVDSLKVLSRLSEGAARAGKVLPVLLQVDLAGEATKAGLEAEELEEILASAGQFPHAEIRGFMLLPPFREDPEEVRPYFRQLRGLRDRMAARFPGLRLDQLSMGMSHDFEVAIQEGATMVRVGTAIFGSRPVPASG